MTSQFTTICAQYHAWISAVKRSEGFRDEYQKSGSYDVKARFDRAREEAETAWQGYEATMNTITNHEGKDIIIRDLLFL